MKNIILQHWTGEMNELGLASSADIQRYAKKVGAEYQLIRGNVFRPELKETQTQKLIMLDPSFDDYDMTVMLDADMFIRKGMDENVFTDVEGVGRHTDIQSRLVRRFAQMFPRFGDTNYPYWGGAIYRLTRDQRKELRQHIREDELKIISKRFFDEGMMHRLAVLSKMEKSYVPGNRWDRGNYEEGVETSAMIHIRTKIAPKGPKRDKIVNYKDLVKRGLIEA